MKLDVSDYSFESIEYARNEEDGKLQEVPVQINVNVKQELYTLLRGNGLFSDGVEIVSAVCIARNIRDCEEDIIDLPEEDLSLLQKAMNKYIARENKPEIGQLSLGGPRYEELILRVFSKE